MVRLDDDVRERLESLSRKEDLSLNHVMNSGLREYAEWGAVYQNAGLAVTGKRLLRELFDNLPEEKARELGRRNGREEAPHMVISWFGNFNLENVLRVFGSILARYSGTFVFEHSQEGRVHTVVVRHEMGSHASAYYAEYARAICELLNMPSRPGADVYPIPDRFDVRARRIRLAGMVVHEAFEYRFEKEVVVSRPCIYGVFSGHFGGFKPLKHKCVGCMRCVQEYPHIMTVKQSDSYKRLGDSFWTPENVYTVWNEASTGKIPGKGMGYKGAFAGEGFDGMLTELL